jgi:hypothetical protein
LSFSAGALRGQFRESGILATTKKTENAAGMIEFSMGRSANELLDTWERDESGNGGKPQ